MAKKAKQPDPDGDDDVYLEVKQEVFGTTNRQKNLAPQETARHQESDATQSTAKFSKETKAALKIVRKHAPSTPLFKTAVSMITEHVLANKMDQPTSSFRRDTFGFIEEELSRKSTPDGKTSLVIEHVRAEVGSALARSLAYVIYNKNDLDRALSTVRSAVEERIPGIAKASIVGDSGKNGTPCKRKRAACEVEAREIKSKSLKIDESSSAEDDAQSNNAKKDFDLDKFTTYCRKEKAGDYAKRHFVDSRKLFEFHAQRRQCTSDKRRPLWSSLTTEQKRAWHPLLTALHQGSKEPVGEHGEELLERQQAKLSGASALVAVNPSSSSSSDDSESDHDTSDIVSSVKDSAISISSSQTSQKPKANKVHKSDSVKQRRAWTEEENKILLIGVRHGWSNEKIQSELPPTSQRTLAAISTARSAAKRMYAMNQAAVRDKPSPALPASIPLSKTSPQPIQAPAPEGQNTVHQELHTPGRSETSSGSNATDRNGQPRPQQPAGPGRQSTSGIDLQPTSASSDAPHPVCAPQHTRSVQWLVHASVERPSPTFVQYKDRPPRTLENRNLNYLLLPIETPDCPAINPSPEDVINACRLAFDKAAAFRTAQKLGGTLWIASFDRSGTSVVPLRRLMQTVIHFRDFQFSARWLSYKPPRTFVADVPQEGVIATSSIVAALKRAFHHRRALPRLGLQSIAGVGQQRSRRILARFPGNPALVQFYIPVQMGSPQRWLHIRFEPLDLGVPCRHCKGLHEDGWCDKAEQLPYAKS